MGFLALEGTPSAWWRKASLWSPLSPPRSSLDFFQNLGCPDPRLSNSSPTVSMTFPWVFKKKNRRIDQMDSLTAQLIETNCLRVFTTMTVASKQTIFQCFFSPKQLGTTVERDHPMTWSDLPWYHGDLPLSCIKFYLDTLWSLRL